jgi:antirestriction protein ArdC
LEKWDTRRWMSITLVLTRGETMSKAYEVITNRIIAKLEAGVVPWHKPWNGEAGMPKNLISKKNYRGINVFLLACLAYESPYFLTFNQTKKLGGFVKKNSRGCPVVFWSLYDRVDDLGQAIRIPVLRHYTVFNVSQCEGIVSPEIDVPEREHSPIEAAEAIAAGMQNAPEIVQGHTQAYYSPILDVVKMPRPEIFNEGEAYYTTLFHELTHATGHSTRLNRHLDSKLAAFGSPDSYSREELIAEMGAAFLAGSAGILESQIDNTSAYLQGWLGVLKSDSRLIVSAAASAQRASDYILGKKYEEAMV